MSNQLLLLYDELCEISGHFINMLVLVTFVHFSGYSLNEGLMGKYIAN